MLGVFGVIVLVLGGFTAGGGIFEWPFLFSDGYREYNWVRSAGREGARGMLILSGGILVVLGFVAQVLDGAARARLDSGRGVGPARFAQTGDAVAPEQPAVDAPAAATPRVTLEEAPKFGGPRMERIDRPSKTSAAASASTSPPTKNNAPAWQPLTIDDAEAVAEGDDTLVMLQYRFEGDNRPVPGGHYFWIIDVLGGVTEIEYDAETLQREGQLTHIVRMPLRQIGFDRNWSTFIVLELSGHRRPISNILQMAPGEEPRSVPPPAPNR